MADFSGGLGSGGGFGSGGVTVQAPPVSFGGGGNNALPGGANNPLTQLTNLLPLLMILGMAGAFPSNYEKSGTSDTTTDTKGTSNLDTILNTFLNSSQQSSGVTGTTPTLSPETQDFMNKLMTKYNAQAAPSLTGYEAQQTNNINTGANAQSQAVNNILAARGLSTSPAAATAEAGLQQNRLNQITNMQQGLPLLKNQLDLQNLAGASAFFSAIPKGSITTTNNQQTSQSTGQQTGSQVGSTTSTGHTVGSTNEKGTSGGGIPGAFQGLGAGLGAILPWLLKTMGIPSIPTTTPTTQTNNADSVPHA